LETFNFTGPLIVAAFAAFGLMWAAGPKNWFKGTRVQGTKEELLEIERELDALEHGQPIGTDTPLLNR
jgi:hypothetical protein